MWQDIPLSLVSILFSVFLIPMIFDSLRGRVVNMWSALATSIGLYSTSTIYLSLGLFFATATTAMSATVWLILLMLAVKYRKV